MNHAQPTEFPADFSAVMQERLAAAFANFELAHRQPAPVSVRLNPKKLVSDTESPIPWTTWGRYLESRPSFVTDPLWHAGAYYVQEASSMFLEQAIEAIGKQTITRALDLCAAPGGKSTHLLSLLNPSVILIANEVIRSRAYILNENIQRWGQPNVIVTNNDPSHFSKMEGFFDLIVVDAPCSGEGLFRKDPEAMQEWSLDNVRLCAARQNRILEDIWPALARGGHLVYCTCTYNPDENEKNLAAFARHHQVEFVSLRHEADWNIETVQQDGVIGYRFYPHRARGEGFFLSVLTKTEGTSATSISSTRKRKQPPNAVLKRVENWVQPGSDVEIELVDDTLYAFPDSDLFGYVRENLKTVAAGTALATIKRDKLVPEPALAFSTMLNKTAFPTIELSLPQAIQYLKKETLSLDTLASGFALATYHGLGLGWMNVLPNRINNLYPSNWRILKA